MKSTILLLLVAACVPVAAADPPPTTPAEKGNTSLLLHLRQTGTAKYERLQIPYILATVRTADGTKEGTVAFYVPPCDFARNAAGKPLIELTDPATFGDFTLPGRDAPCTVEEFAKAVSGKIVLPETKVIVTLTIQFHSHAAIEYEVLKAVRAQTGLKVEQPLAKTAAPPPDITELSRAQQSLQILPAGSVTFSPQLVAFGPVEFKHKGTPAQEIRVQAEVPARFVNALNSTGGVEMKATWAFAGYDQEINRAAVKKQTEDFSERTVTALGKGKLAHDKFGGKGDIQILTTRQELDSLNADSKWKEEVVVSAGDREMAKSLLELLARKEADIFATTADEVQRLLEDFASGLKDLKSDGLTTLLDELVNSDTLTNDQIDTFRKEASSATRRGNSAESTSVLGLVGHSKAGGYEIAETKLLDTADRKALLNIMKSLRTYRKEGRFPIPKDLDLRLVNKSRLQKDLEQQMSIILAGTVRTHALTTAFGSAKPTLIGGSPGLAELTAREAAITAATQQAPKP